ncbi:MAG: hypothetical protein ACK4K7_00700 [Allosphingosinicella sp.]|uniref:hypothetical protein n=1 Tax=Allosphingosinicella sp. TaxID=2823234 RepID=UPI0039542F52
MRKLFLAAAAWGAAGAAAAQVTLVYEAPGGARLKVEADAAGHARVGPEGGSEYSLFRPDGAYGVLTGGDRPAVVRYADLHAASGEKAASIAGAAGAGPDGPPAIGFWLRPDGEETVGGRTGTRWILPESPLGADGSLVLAEDPALALAGAALAEAIAESPLFAATIAGRPPGFAAELAELLKRGAPLRIERMVLAAEQSGPIAAERFAVPAEPMSRDELAAMLADDEDPGH